MATKKKTTKKKAAKAKAPSEAEVEKWLEMKIRSCCTPKKKTTKCRNDCGSGFYFLGALGAAIYYISISTGFWNGVLGVLKALVWPVFLVFELLVFIGA